MLTRAARFGWLVVGFVALALGALGIAIPLLPTTPFVLVAAFAFAQSSEKLHQWLVNHNVFGTLIDNWQRHGAISRRAKIASVVSMAAVLAISVVMGAPAAVIVVQLELGSLSPICDARIRVTVPYLPHCPLFALFATSPGAEPPAAISGTR
jgi:uncharacterized membrane protein YbaN (DUF454 family)